MNSSENRPSGAELRVDHGSIEDGCVVDVGPYRCGSGQPLLLIAGPCVLQSLSLSLEIAETIAKLNQRDDVNVV
jgi:3-deoxy-D-manno-octulosonic acid (KDO) 8-phosphate synthase